MLCCLACSTACATAARSGGGPDPKLITAEEMEEAGFNDAYSLVQALRPQRLWTRGTSTINQRESIKVYMDESLMGGPEYLRQIVVRSVASIQFLDGLEATNRWGLDHGLGAIVVRTRRDG